MKTKAHLALLPVLASGLACADARVMAEMTETEIQPLGGIARSPDGKLELTFPSQAVAVVTKVRIEIDRTRPAADRLTPIYRLGPDGLQFGMRVDLRLEASRPSGRAVVLAQIIGDRAIPLEDSTYSAEQGAALATLMHFSDYVLIIEPDSEAGDGGVDAGRAPDASDVARDVGWPDAGESACTFNPIAPDAAVELRGFVGEAEPNDTPESAQYLPWDPTCSVLTVEASFATRFDTDYYFFNVPLGKVGAIRALTHTEQLPLGACDGAYVDTVLSLLDSQGRTLALDDPGAGQPCSEINPYTPGASNLAPGAYYLRAQTHVASAVPGFEPPYYLSIQLDLR